MGCASAARARNAACTGADPEAPRRPPAPHRWRLDDRSAAGCGFRRHGNRGSRANHSAVRDGAVRVIGPDRGVDCGPADHCGRKGCVGAGLSRVRRRLAEIWHILSIVYIGAIYLAYALRVEGGSGFILRATLVSLVVIVGARLLVRFIEQLSAQGFAVAPDLKARFPELEKRDNRYLPILTGLSAVAIYALAFLLVLP